MAKPLTRLEKHRLSVRGTYTPPHDAPDSLVQAVDTVLFIATWLHHDRQSDEILTECRMCGDWEGHTPTCPVPQLTEWLRVQQTMKQG